MTECNNNWWNETLLLIFWLTILALAAIIFIPISNTNKGGGNRWLIKSGDYWFEKFGSKKIGGQKLSKLDPNL